MTSPSEIVKWTKEKLNIDTDKEAVEKAIATIEKKEDLNLGRKYESYYCEYQGKWPDENITAT